MGLARIPVLNKRINVAMGTHEELEKWEVELLPSYKNMKPGSCRVAVALFNNSQEKVTLKKGMVIVRIMAVNITPPLLAPSSGMYQNVPDSRNATEGSNTKGGYVPETKGNIIPNPEPTPEQLDTLFQKLDLTGLNEWPECEQNQACELI